MKRFLRFLGLAFTVLALCLPVGLMVVYLLYPLWRWLETTFGIESVGDTGPAPWCFAVVYVALVVAASIALWAAGRQRRTKLDSNPQSLQM